MATVNSVIQLKPSDCAWLSSRTVYVALSGGIDSVVLAHLLHRANIPFTAIHINHQLHANAEQWQAFCEQFCHSLGTKIVARSVCIHGQNNLEAKARKARYEAINDAVKADAVVCFAHHQSDVAETFLLQVKRGSGSNGLTSLRRKRTMRFENKSWTAFRPILDVSKNEIFAYAQTHGLGWVEDPSNATLAHERNIIRHQIIKPLQQYWSDIESRIARTVGTLLHENSLLMQVCEERVAQCLESDSCLNLKKLSAFSEEWQAQIIRHYCLSYYQLNLSQAHLHELMKLCHSREDAQGKMVLGDFVLRRYQGVLYVLPINGLSNASQQNSAELNIHIEWLTTPCQINDDTLYCSDNSVVIPLPENIDEQQFAQVTCEAVALSERIKPYQARHSKPLKQWLQAQHIPPWQRQPCYKIEYKNTQLAYVCPGLALVLSEQNKHSMRVTFAK